MEYVIQLLESKERELLHKLKNMYEDNSYHTAVSNSRKEVKKALLILHSVSISLPSREDYDNRKLKTMYFKKDTSVGNSVLFVKGEEWQPYNWNYSRTIDYLKEGRLGYEC